MTLVNFFHINRSTLMVGVLGTYIFHLRSSPNGLFQPPPLNPSVKNDASATRTCLAWAKPKTVCLEYSAICLGEKKKIL